MQYYYSLLENYEQLKRRQFKLSLREEEGEKMSDEEKVTDLQNKAGEKRENPGNINGINIYKQGDDVLAFDPGDNREQTAGVVKNGQLGKSPAALKLLGIIYGSGEEEEGGDKDKDPEGGEETGQDQIVDPALQRRDQAVENLSAKIDTMTAADFTPKYEEAKRKERQKKGVELAKAQAAGETEGGEGISTQSSLYGTDIQSQVISSPEIPPEKVAESCEAVSESLDLVKKIGRGEDLTTAELASIIRKVKVTDQGVAYAGVYHQVRTKATEENDPYLNNIIVINEKIKEHNKKLSKLPKDSKERRDNELPELVAKKSNIGRDLSKRGPMLEQVSVLDSLATAFVSVQDSGGDTQEIEKQLEEYFKKATADKSIEEMKQMLQKGLCSQAGQCLLSIDDADDPIVTQGVMTFLTGKDADGNDVPDYEGPGIDEKKARALVESASKNGVEALALLVLSTRGFNKVYSDLDVVGAQQLGDVGATDPGGKTDVEKTVTEESFERFAQKLEENKTETEKQLAKAAGCAGSGVGMASMKAAVQEAKGSGTVKVATEQKAQQKLEGGRTKAGEQNDSAFRNRCNGEPEKTDNAKKFIEANNERLNNCLKGKKFGTHKTAQEAACAFQKKIDQSPTMKAFRAITGSYIKGEDGTRVEHTGAALADVWENGSSMREVDRKERAKLARDGFAALEQGKTMKDLPANQREAITKIGLDLEKGQISRLLDQNTGTDGTVNGEGLGYLLVRHTQSAASLNECMKDVRGYEDGGQRLGLINESVYGSVGMVSNGSASVVRKPGSYGYNIEDGEGRKLMGGGFERGQLVSNVDVNNSMSNPKDWKKGESKKEELFMTFLKGQRELLEKLMHQTKTGPNP